MTSESSGRLRRFWRAVWRDMRKSSGDSTPTSFVVYVSVAILFSVIAVFVRVGVWGPPIIFFVATFHAAVVAERTGKKGWRWAAGAAMLMAALSFAYAYLMLSAEH